MHPFNFENSSNKTMENTKFYKKRKEVSHCLLQEALDENTNF